MEGIATMVGITMAGRDHNGEYYNNGWGLQLWERDGCLYGLCLEKSNSFFGRVFRIFRIFFRVGDLLRQFAVADYRGAALRN
jgi:hypothetical protein